jgi:hypothetical protein
MSYALVENGEVTQVGLPQTGTLKDGGTVSGYHLLDESILLAEGWLPLVDNQLVYDVNTETLVQVGYTVEVTQVVKNYQVIEIGLDIIKQRKLDELKSLEITNLATFKSSALGTEHTYLSRASTTDMLLISDEYHFIIGPLYDNVLPIWYTVESGNVSHTIAQFTQVYLDARTNVKTVKYHRSALEYQVSLATTDSTAKVDAIIW